MMPFSVLRIWGAGLVSWMILIGGVYCLWKWYDSQRPSVVVVERVEEPIDDPVSADQRIVQTRPANWAWPLLIAGIVLIGLSGFGALPMTLLLGRPTLFGRPTVKAKALPDNRTGHWIDRPDGSRLYVEVFGAASGPTLVFTHGWSLDHTVWNDVGARLARRFRIVVWDLPGLGWSKGPRDGNYSLEKMASDLLAVVQQEGGKHAILVGHSIGGMITQTFCRLYPEELSRRIVGLVLLHTTYVNPLRTALFAPMWTAIEKPILVPLNHLTVWLAPLAFLSNLQGFLNGSTHVMTRIASFSGKQTWGQLHYGSWLAARSWPGVIARGNLAMFAFNEDATLRQLDVPVLVIAGKHDRLTKPSASERIEQLLPHGVLATVATGHLGFWEDDARVSELIAEFADRFEVRGETAAKTPAGQKRLSSR